MAQNLQVTGIKLDTRSLRRGASRAEREFRKMEKRADKLEKEVDETSMSMKKLGAAAAGVASAFGGLFVLQRAARFVFNTNREFEQLEARLISITGSVSDAEKAFDLIVDFASETPFQIQSLTEAFTKLSAVGLQPTADMLRDLGNFAAAFGADIVDFTNAVIRAGTGMTRPLKKFGIIARSEGDKLKVTFRGITRTVQKDFASVMGLFREMSQEQFAGGMARQMDTLNGIISNLKDNASILAKQIGEAGLNAAIKDLVILIRDAIAEGDEFAESMGQFLAGSVRLATEALEVFIDHGDLIIQTLQTLAGAVILRSVAPAFTGMIALMQGATGASITLTSALVPLRAALAALGGPAGLLALAGSALVTYALNAERDASPATKGLAEEIDGLKESLVDLNRTEVELRIAEFGESIETRMQRLEELRSDIADQSGEIEAGVGAPTGPASFERPGTAEARQEMQELQEEERALQQQILLETEALDALGGRLQDIEDAENRVTKSKKGNTEATAELIQKLEEERDKLKFSELQLLQRTEAFRQATPAQKAHILSTFEEVQALEAEEEAQEKAAEAAEERRKKLEQLADETMENARRVREENDRIEERARRQADQFAANLQLAQIQEEMRRIEEFSDRVGEAFADMAMDVAFESESMLDAVQGMVEGILRQIARLVLARTVGKFVGGLVSGALGGGIPDAPGAIPEPTAPTFAGGFQHGGRFKVGGTGGPDSKLVSFRATPGEEVTVMPPGRGGGGAGGGGTVQVFQEVNMSPNMVDESAGRRFLETHRGDIVKIFLEAAENDAVRRAFQMGAGS